ncbi:hypothetical protein CEV32_2248 [Brucella rhizosphaerae]|uniref:Uncharacterized protein n=1 Tax=Brucella rhizosphaerae TaxID=571254 RepID=A0A256F4P0_9HYPH|nr:hypothetical protein CEV32_2248 [Brucella rhizosphaerae]
MANNHVTGGSLSHNHYLRRSSTISLRHSLQLLRLSRKRFHRSHQLML